MSLRVSHQITWPSAPPEKNSVLVLLLIHNTRLALSRWQISRGVVDTGDSPARTSHTLHCPFSWPLTKMLMSLCWYSTHIDGLVGLASLWSGWFGFSVSQMYELDESWREMPLKLVSQYVMAIFNPPSGDHDKWLIGRCSSAVVYFVHRFIVRQWMKAHQFWLKIRAQNASVLLIRKLTVGVSTSL